LHWDMVFALSRILYPNTLAAVPCTIWSIMSAVSQTFCPKALATAPWPCFVTALAGIVLDVPSKLYNLKCVLGDPSRWNCVAEIAEESGLRQRVIDNFNRDCNSLQDMYPFRLQVEQVFEVQNAACRNAFQSDELVEELGDSVRLYHGTSTRLYHGTSTRAAKAILQSGFAVPKSAGFRMFGQGIYFAQNPLKCWQYSTKGNSPYIIVCDVRLGHQREMAMAAPRFTQNSLLRPLSLAHAMEYHSVRGLTVEEGGSLRLPEYIVYRSEQALPTYLLRVREVHR